MTDTARTLERTRIAIEAWDALRPVVDQMLWDARTPRDVYRALAFDRLCANFVREAFYTDTQNVNSRSRAYLVHPGDAWIRNAIRRKP